MGYPGGKNGMGVYQTIINEIPPHEIYIELFAGGGAILRLKRPARSSIAVDADADAVKELASLELPGLQVICGDALRFLSSYRWKGTEFVYLDPPYLWDVRSSKQRIYQHEFYRESEHLELLSLIKQVPVPVMISGYASALYSCELEGWRTLTYTTMTRGAKPAQEWLWMNYTKPTMLHDFRYVGADYRERENLARRIKRLKTKLAGMGEMERFALLAAIQESSTLPATALVRPLPAGLAWGAAIDGSADDPGVTGGDVGIVEAADVTRCPQCERRARRRPPTVHGLQNTLPFGEEW